MHRLLRRSFLLLIVFVLFSPDWIFAQAIPATLSVKDFPDDDGTSLVLAWSDLDVEASLRIERSVSTESTWIEIAQVEAASGGYIDTGLKRGIGYIYRICLGDSVLAYSNVALPRASILNRGRLNQLFILVLFFTSVLISIRLASKGREFFVRRISGLSAIEEAIGRATEMGKPVLFVPGIDDLNNIQTIASMVILNDVARLAATYETPVIVPVCKPFVVPVAEEAVRQGFLSAGKPDLYNPDNVRYLSDEQFAFTAGVNGIMLREKTAANIYMGSFFAESLILAETGFSTGAIQIAGTANIHQLPFFVAACDYTLIGEELFAASAYLSREPKLLGALKASDLAKAIIVLIVLIGVITETIGWHGFADLFIAR